MVDPNRADDLSGLGHLAAVGLVFLTLVAVTRELRRRNFWTGLRSEPDLLSLLHLVALGTVADVVPLHGLNRAFVAKGLIALKRREHPGPTALMDVARLSGPPSPGISGFFWVPASTPVVGSDGPTSACAFFWRRTRLKPRGLPPSSIG